MRHEVAEASAVEQTIKIVARNVRRLVVRLDIDASRLTELLRAVERE